jgi:hypothetical protein
MSNVISFLQAMGAESAPSSDTGYREAVASLDVDPEMRAALLARDTAAINRLLGGRGNVFSLLVPAEDDDKKDGEEPAEDDKQQEQIRVA